MRYLEGSAPNGVTDLAGRRARSPEGPCPDVHRSQTTQALAGGSVLALIAEYRPALLAYLEEYERQYAVHAESLAAGRIVPFQTHLLGYVHPSIRHLVDGSQKEQQG